MRIDVTAQLTASVVAVAAAVGDDVDADATLLTVESMKMEIPVAAPRAGRVTEVAVAVGDVIAEGDLLVVLEASDA